jgi:hypothetical protein
MEPSLGPMVAWFILNIRVDVCDEQADAKPADRSNADGSLQSCCVPISAHAIYIHSKKEMITWFRFAVQHRVILLYERSIDAKTNRGSRLCLLFHDFKPRITW